MCEGSTWHVTIENIEMWITNAKTIFLPCRTLKIIKEYQSSVRQKNMLAIKSPRCEGRPSQAGVHTVV